MINSQEFAEKRFTIVEPFLSADEVDALIHAVESAVTPERRHGGTRDVMDTSPELALLAKHPVVQAMVKQVLGEGAFVVRATLFDKTDTANWKVPWHQDVTVAVSNKIETPEYGPWSTKMGVAHVQPPTRVLEKMVTVRIHLDPCPCENGALRVMPGTHALGRLNQNHVDEHVNEASSICCEVEAGGALIMRPLLLHASSASSQPRHRRVVHFDFAVDQLDGCLRWRLQS